MKKIILLSIGILVTTLVFGQGGGLSDKVYFGGGMGFNAGTGFINVSVSPLVGYKITERFSSGVGVTYQYVRIDLQPDPVVLSHYGLSPFSRYMITRQFFAHTEFEYLTIEYPTTIDYSETARRGFSSWFVGGGFVQPLGRIASFTLIGLYNILYDQDNPQNSPYRSPFLVRGGINVGF